MEELILTDPVVVPEKVTDKYKVMALTMNWEQKINITSDPGYILIELKDNNNERLSHSYSGTEATDMMKWMNKADFSVNSMHKRILQKLSNDGVIPGTVSGAADDPPLDF